MENEISQKADQRLRTCIKILKSMVVDWYSASVMYAFSGVCSICIS